MCLFSNKIQILIRYFSTKCLLRNKHFKHASYHNNYKINKEFIICKYYK